MQARTIAKQIAYGRIAIGAALLVKPDLVTGRWVGPVADSPGGRVLAVAFGARDLAVGAGTAFALHTGASARPWLVAAVFTDAVDAVATGGARRSLPTPGALGTVALASVSAAVGAWTASQLD
ncbi:hypothetical protein OM076_30410 [Solirubrobacter ginsenosidimutans]|uniref:DUF4267 domain-containing protein n=1 Tax=Solirubrobacter ginsenosidimutans TaxID=490573 RepID=A0A9X3MXF4_9ACTN|nr:hypothetical protein [Solirubrobacter ginsenosidimutans]MDA0164619.1 hypothetical protein [Solirubrobacter ginsenosidimutans]